MGIGTVKDLAEARAWYRAAAEHGDKRANQRLSALGGQPVPMANELAGVGAGPPRPDVDGPYPSTRPQQAQQGPARGPPVRPVAMTAKEQGERVAAQHAHRMITEAEQARQQAFMASQPTNAPFPSAIGSSVMSPNSANGPTSYPTPMAMKETQTSQREHAYQMAVQQQQQRQRMNGSPAESTPFSQSQRPSAPYGAEAAYLQQLPTPPSMQPYQQQQPMPPSQKQQPMPPFQQQQSMPPYQQQQQRPPPNRQGSMPPNSPPGQPDYPTYPNQMGGGSPDPRFAGSPTSSAPSEKKRSLWSQLKEI